MTFLVYKHTNNISGKSYIGYTKNSIDARWKEHQSLARYRKSNIKFWNAIRKYPEDSWIHEILLDNISSLEETKQKEIEMIVHHDTFNNGYNSTLGGDGSGPCSEEKKIKISESEKGKINSEETRKRMSSSKIGIKRKPFTEETKKRMSEAKKGKKRPPITEETRKRLSVSSFRRKQKELRIKAKYNDFTGITR